ICDTQRLECIQHMAHIVAVEQIADTCFALCQRSQQQNAVGQTFGTRQRDITLNMGNRVECQTGQGSNGHYVKILWKSVSGQDMAAWISLILKALDPTIVHGPAQRPVYPAPSMDRPTGRLRSQGNPVVLKRVLQTLPDFFVEKEHNC